MLLHEASIIATKERAEMKMIEFFIARKIVVDGAGHSITNRCESQSVQDASTASGRYCGASPGAKASVARSSEAGKGRSSRVCHRIVLQLQFDGRAT